MSTEDIKLEIKRANASARARKYYNSKKDIISVRRKTQRDTSKTESETKPDTKPDTKTETKTNVGSLIKNVTKDIVFKLISEKLKINRPELKELSIKTYAYCLNYIYI